MLAAVILGVVQGLTEFLPVSSSGHLVIARRLLAVEPPGVLLEVVLHLATLFAVVWVYRKRLAGLVGDMARGGGEAWRYAALLALASVPAGVVGVAGRTAFEATFARPVLAAIMLLVTGGFVYSLKFTADRTAGAPSASSSVWMGVTQALAILPGISRSGSTVAVGVWRGIQVERAAEFSFLMSIPAILGAALLQLDSLDEFAAIGAPGLLAGFVAALVTGIVAIRLFLAMLRAHKFHYFAWYCWAVGFGYLIAALLVPALR